jgi:hypothetical protein
MKPQPTHVTTGGLLAGIYSTDNGGDYPVHAWLELLGGQRVTLQLTADLKNTKNEDEPLIKPLPKKLESYVWVIWYSHQAHIVLFHEPNMVNKQNAIAIKKFNLIAEEGEGV